MLAWAYLSGEHDGQIVQDTFAKLGVVTLVFVQPFHCRGHVCEIESVTSLYKHHDVRTAVAAR